MAEATKAETQDQSQNQSQAGSKTASKTELRHAAPAERGDLPKGVDGGPATINNPEKVLSK